MEDTNTAVDKANDNGEEVAAENTGVENTDKPADEQEQTVENTEEKAE